MVGGTLYGAQQPVKFTARYAFPGGSTPMSGPPALRRNGWGHTTWQMSLKRGAASASFPSRSAGLSASTTSATVASLLVEASDGASSVEAPASASVCVLIGVDMASVCGDASADSSVLPPQAGSVASAASAIARSRRGQRL